LAAALKSNDGIDRDAWVSALRDVATQPLPDDHPDAVTVAQFAEMIGISRVQAYRKLLDLEKAGRAERVKKRQRASDGGIRPVDAYRLLPAKSEKPAKRK